MIDIKSLHKSYGSTRVLEGIDLSVESGQVVCLIGPSGSGKSTLLRCINGLETYEGGDILVGSERVDRHAKSIHEIRTQVAMVFQRFNLFPHRTALQNVMEGPVYVKKEDPAAAREHARALLEKVGLSHRMDAYPDELSGGQQQRVALARALVNYPSALLLDEPLGALDLKLRHVMQFELKRIQREVGITFIYVTHDQEEAMRLSQRIAIFSHGKIVGLGTGYDLYQNPPNAFVASFLGNSNFLRVKAHGNGAASFEGQPVAMRLTSGVSDGQEVLLMVRPEKALALSREQAAQEALPAGWNEVTAKVGEVLFLGESQTCSVVTAGGTQMTVKALSVAGMSMKPGDEVKVRWAVADACVYTEWQESDLNKAAGAH
ncbi:MAG TPA: polyamine ABC transporter ATP-binding protein [Pseudomonas sp.]|nr:polyamine ABC transporter ATP-binding protein [Pseudomonas sp.]